MCNSNGGGQWMDGIILLFKLINNNVVRNVCRTVEQTSSVSCVQFNIIYITIYMKYI